MAVDPAFGVNSFNTPKYYNESETVAKNILTLLYGRPGFYPSIPTLGMNVRTLLYVSLDDIDTDMLKVMLVQQCSAFITQVRDGTFDVKKALYQGRPMLVFIIPVIVKQVSQRIAIGITTNTKGEAIYNFNYVTDES